jgi:hypothetical protein
MSDEPQLLTDSEDQEAKLVFPDLKRGDAWGDSITKERAGELEAKLQAREQEADHGEWKGPFDIGPDKDWVTRTGAEVFWLAARALAGTSEAQAVADQKERLRRVRDNWGSYYTLRLDGLHLEGVHLLGAHLEGAILGGAQLQGANLSYTELQGAGLYDAQLQGANLSNTELQRSGLGGAQLQGASFVDAHLEGCDLTHAYLDSATDLTGSG